MKVLGLRCSSKDYAFGVLGGALASPDVLDSGLVMFPKGFSRVQSVKWFLQELDSLLSKHQCDLIIIKGFEGRTRDKSFVERVEHEAIAFLAAANHGIKMVLRKVKSTIAKDLGLKGRARYLSSTLDTSHVPNFADYPDKIQEAILAVWSGLNRTTGHSYTQAASCESSSGAGSARRRAWSAAVTSGVE